MFKITRKFVLAAVCLYLHLIIAGCEDTSAYAPVEESRSVHFSVHQKTYKVRQGDTLYAIAFLFDKDYQQLATFNHLQKPYSLFTGQVIYLQYPSKPTNYRFHAYFRSPPIKKEKTHAIPAYHPSVQWSWPASGSVISKFFPAYAKKGIEIAGNKGDGIYASAPGVVAYAGNGISGYGNLILIKHRNQFLTAYGYNARNLVYEGQIVQQGQRIADMGRIVGRRIYAVHFEIRKAGLPVNPLNYLKKY